MKIKKSTAVLFVFTLYGVNFFFFERVLFFNELLSLIGFYYFVKRSFDKKFAFHYPHNTVYKSVLLFILLGVFYALLSLWLKTNWYFYFRNLSILYSAFTFYIGYYLYPYQFNFFTKIKGWIYAYALISFSWRWEFLIDRNAYSYWFAWLSKDWRIKSVAIFLLLCFLYLISYTSLTVILIVLFVLAIRYLKNYQSFKLIGMLSIIGLGILMALAIPYLKLYQSDTYYLFGDVKHVYAQHPWFSIDHNTSWRLLLWYRTLIEAFPQNLLGIGIGTPLIPYEVGINTTLLPYDDEYIAHVIGTHNTFITLFIRFGILSTLLFAVIYNSVLTEFFNYKKYYLNHQNDGGLFLGFIALTAVGLFNLLIETPTLASAYWVSLGFVGGAITNRKKRNDELQNLL